jgi:hypothetical protein
VGTSCRRWSGVSPRARRPGAPRAWHAFQRLTTYGFPRRFQVVQFPNAPLILGFVLGIAARYASGSPHDYLQSAAYLSMTVWAYEELAHGSNWFRRLLGAAYAVILVIRVAHAISS